MTAAAVRAEGLGKTYGSGAGAVRVFSRLSLDLYSGDFAAITGPSGCGKSTLLHLLAGIDEPSEGRVEIEGVELATLDLRRRARLRNERIGFVFQHHHLLPEFSAVENVSLPMRIGGRGRREAERRAADLLARVGLQDRVSHLPSEMSGGELQRAAVARALACDPPILFADEPTGNLDRENADRLFALLQELHSERGGVVAIVTHDRDLASRCGKIFSMTNGGLRAADV
jgi:lipoprotein-releasing system ATP-binding protein